MKKIPFILFMLLLPGIMLAQSTCTITATIYEADGSAAAGEVIRISPISGDEIVDRPIYKRTNSSGVAVFKLLQGAYYYIYADVVGMRGDNNQGNVILVPNASSSTLDNLLSGFTILAVSDSNDVVDGYVTVTYLDSVATTPTTLSDSLDAVVVRDQDDQNAGFAGGDSVNTALASNDTDIATNADGIAGKADADSVQTAIASNDTDIQSNSDSLAVHRTQIDLNEQKADTARTTVIAGLETEDTNQNDTLAVHRTKLDANEQRADTARNTVISNIESDVANRITISANSDTLDVLTDGGARSVSSTGRIFVAEDSITFTRLNGDAIDASLGNAFRGTLDANDTLQVDNMRDGQVLQIVITNGGTYTLDWSGVNWTGGTVPTLTSGANKRDVYSIMQVGNIKYGTWIGDME